MIRRSFVRALALASLLVFALSASAVAATKVNVRVEGAKATLFEGNVAVSAGKLTSNTGEDRSSHLCNVAANGGSGPPAATPTRALQAASENALGDRLAPLSFEWYASFSDFLIGSIGGEAPTGDNYWELSINWKVAELGGCAVALKKGDKVLWAVSDGTSPALRLDAPRVARKGRPFKVRVTSGATGKAVAGARVGGAMTAANGIARLTLKSGSKRALGATKRGAIRSNIESVVLR
ncbi:MAG: DUF4430 domain-containing protein [Solirubrobacteraceae bacterium]|jgi:hypothetical protein|nr:DUF4430 domain-containing protein [Solirubrobacteraceae bacterium]MDP4921835.1 DUF4430 domain-containing protein [Solirubrobacteraceae bacterium]MDP5033381.1 DUF4430 domain-containing protein [Solirubrobacteraceae bacterium]